MPDEFLKPMHFPMTITANWTITAQEYEYLQAGYDPISLSDRWIIYSNQGSTHLHRNWTGKEVYNFSPIKNGDSYTIDDFNFVRVFRQLWLPKEHKETVKNVLFTVLGSVLDVHPCPVDIA
jgi:hypothetical protein